jgi:hypothetical protein
MKKLLIVSLLALGISAGVQAHEGAGKREFREPDWSRIAQHLEVTESQLPAFEAAMKAHHEKRRELHKEFLRQHQALEEEQRADLEGVLTQEQLEKLDAIKQKPVHHWHQRVDHARGDGKREFRHYKGEERKARFKDKSEQQ